MREGFAQFNKSRTASSASTEALIIQLFIQLFLWKPETHEMKDSI